VLLGDGSALAERFGKLRIFYEKGIPKADWRRYGRIDLRFADQIVCTKRTTP
jgi:cell division protein FtsQ